jgi:hypothetical protein
MQTQEPKCHARYDTITLKIKLWVLKISKIRPLVVSNFYGENTNILMDQFV